MRKILLFVWACMGLVCLMSACKTSVKSKEWKLVWVEDFDQKNVCIRRKLGLYLVERGCLKMRRPFFVFAKKSGKS